MLCLNNLKKAVLVSFLLLLLFTFASSFTASYEAVIEENGRAFVAASFQGEGTLNVPLPEDADELIVENALYVQASNGIDLSIGSTQTASIYFVSDLLTSKSSGEWLFEQTLPTELEKFSLFLYLPKTALIKSTLPNAVISNTEESKLLKWDFLSSPLIPEKVSAKYGFTGSAQTPNTQTALTSSEWQTALIGLGIIIILIVAFFFLFSFFQKNKKRVFPKKQFEEKQEKKPEILKEEKSAQKEMLKTFTENQKKIVELLLKYRGEIKRNQLERESGISKSSLAASLFQLEQKNVIQIDKANVVHYIRLTEWFKNL